MFTRKKHAYHNLEDVLGYRFRDPVRLETALTHRSFRFENREAGVDNERLEFLGDAVLGFLLADLVYERYEEHPEGVLTILRSRIVSTSALASVARDIGLGAHLRLGRGEVAGGGRERESMLADAMEALLAALYLDGKLDHIKGSEASKMAQELSEEFVTLAKRVVALETEEKRLTADLIAEREISKKMAERLAASPSTPEYGALTVQVQMDYAVQLLRRIPPQVFFPSPEVDSVYLRLQRRAVPVAPAVRSLCRDLVRLGFSQRRKKLLKLLATQCPRPRLEQAFKELNLSVDVRAEAVSVERFLALARALQPNAAVE